LEGDRSIEERENKSKSTNSRAKAKVKRRRIFAKRTKHEVYRAESSLTTIGGHGRNKNTAFTGFRSLKS